MLIHESNFYRQGTTPWANNYYTDKGKTLPLTPPFDLAAEDPSNQRTDENRGAIWDAYARLVAFASEALSVVTSEDICSLAHSTVKPAP